jgi:hypothetical protein
LDAHPVGQGASVGRPGPIYKMIYSAYQAAKAA